MGRQLITVVGLAGRAGRTLSRPPAGPPILGFELYPTCISRARSVRSARMITRPRCPSICGGSTSTNTALNASPGGWRGFKTRRGRSSRRSRTTRMTGSGTCTASITGWSCCSPWVPGGRKWSTTFPGTAGRRATRLPALSTSTTSTFSPPGSAWAANPARASAIRPAFTRGGMTVNISPVLGRT